MSYHRDSQKSIVWNILGAVMLLLFLLIVFLFAAPAAYRLDQRIADARIGWSQAISSATTTPRAIQQENEILTERVLFLQQQNALLRLKTPANLAFVSDNSLSRIGAWVTHRHPYSLTRYWIIDQGESQGVSIGDEVYSGDVAIGIIEDTTSTASEILPFFAGGTTTQAIHQASGFSIEVTGRGQGVYTADIPRDFVIDPGDLIQWQGSRDIAVLGFVDTIVVDDRDALQKVFITLPTHPKKIHWVEVQK